MKKLAANIPGLNTIYDFYKDNPNQPGKIQTLGDLLSGLFNIAFYIALFLAFFYLVWGAFSYIMAQGNKENLAKARARLTWAILGLIIVLLAFFIARFVSEILPPRPGGLPF